jgi:DNA-binding CsgD family transcriptional regulator
MSPVSQVAVAKDYSTSWAPRVLALAPVGAFDRTPPRDPNDPLWLAALKAVEGGAAESALGAVWEDLGRGRLRPWCEATTRDGIYLIARLNCTHPSVAHGDAAVLVRVLCGEPQKVIASELGIATSTTSGRYLRALDQLDLGNRTLPLPLVLAAQSWAGIARVPRARTAIFEECGELALVVSVPRPVTAHMTTLTRAEQEVAKCLIEGDCRKEIARRRETSVHTVARQFSSVFTALRIGGRYALIRCAVERRCFS